MIEKEKIYFLGKYILYGIKDEVAVLAKWACCYHKQALPGSVSDFGFFQRSKKFNLDCTRKSDLDADDRDVGIHREIYPTKWTILSDNGYQAATVFLPAIHPVRKHLRGYPSFSDQAYNQHVSSDRVIVESFFGSPFWFMDCLCFEMKII